MAENSSVTIRGGYVPFTLKRNERLDVLGQALNKLDLAAKEADDKRTAVAEAFANARNLLPDNEETNQYITDNQNRIINTIDEDLVRGKFYDAIRDGKKLASDFMSSPEFIARTKEHKQRNIWLEELNRSSVDNYIKDYYKDIYKDKNNFTRDENGNVTGTAGWEAPLPEQGQSATAIIQMAVKATADERTDRSSSWSGEGGGGHNAYRQESLAASKISSTAKSIVNSDSRVRQAFVDQYNAGIHQINKLQKQLSTETDANRRASIENQIAGYKKSFYKNEAPMSSADDYIDNLFSPQNDEIKNAAYNYIHTNTGSSSGSSGAGGAGAVGGGLQLSLGAMAESSMDLSSPGHNVEGINTGSGMKEPPRGAKRPTSRNNNTSQQNNTSKSSLVLPGNTWAK